MTRGDGETCSYEGLKDRAPALSARVMVREDEKSFGTEYSLALPPHSAQAISKKIRIAGLNLIDRSRCGRCRTTENEALPHVEEIGKLGVVDIVKERRVRHYRVHTLRGNVGA